MPGCSWTIARPRYLEKTTCASSALGPCHTIATGDASAHLPVPSNAGSAHGPSAASARAKAPHGLKHRACGYPYRRDPGAFRNCLVVVQADMMPGTEPGLNPTSDHREIKALRPHIGGDDAARHTYQRCRAVCRLTCRLCSATYSGRWNRPTSRTPHKKPPMCAQKATPPVSLPSAGRPYSNCIKNQ